MIFILIAIIWLTISIWIAFNAKSNNRSPVFWGIFTFLTGLLGMIIYAIVIASSENPENGSTTFSLKPPSKETLSSFGGIFLAIIIIIGALYGVLFISNEISDAKDVDLKIIGSENIGKEVLVKFEIHNQKSKPVTVEVTAQIKPPNYEELDRYSYRAETETTILDPNSKQKLTIPVNRGDLYDYEVTARYFVDTICKNESQNCQDNYTSLPNIS